MQILQELFNDNRNIISAIAPFTVRKNKKDNQGFVFIVLEGIS